MDALGVSLLTWESSRCFFFFTRLAARSDDRWMVEVLLTFGADPEMKNIHNEVENRDGGPIDMID